MDTPERTWVPYGDTEVCIDGYDREPCPECVGHGECPQCGGELDDYVCTECYYEVDLEGPVHRPDPYADWPE